MKLISPTDSMFLLAESREHPMHVGGLQLFDPPEGVSGSDVLREIHQAMSGQTDFSRRSASTPQPCSVASPVSGGPSTTTSTSTTT